MCFVHTCWAKGLRVSGHDVVIVDISSLLLVTPQWRTCTYLLTIHTAQRQTQVENFLKLCVYYSGNYDSTEDLKKASEKVTKWYTDNNIKSAENRVFYLALPPSQFVNSGKVL